MRNAPTVRKNYQRWHKSDHRAVATWEAALQELLDRGLLAARGDRGEIYEITKKGYEAASFESHTKGLP